MRRIDEPHTECPCCGTSWMVAALRLKGVRTGRNRVGHLMCVTEIAAVVPKPPNQHEGPSCKVFPHFLRDLKITAP